MAIITEAAARARAQKRLDSLSNIKNSNTILNEVVASAASSDKFDVFLSHSIQDADLVHGVYLMLQDQGLKVYVDWIVDPSLDRNNVTKATAEKIRTRLKQCKSLLYLTSDNSTNSKWMPWECGFKDGQSGLVAIFPLTKSSFQSKFEGVEYLSLYPFVSDGGSSLWIHESISSFKLLKNWLGV